MPKSFYLESVRHALFRGIERAKGQSRGRAKVWEDVLATLALAPAGEGVVAVSWSAPSPGEVRFSRRDFTLYQRGDTPGASLEDPLPRNNAAADRIVAGIADQLGWAPEGGPLPEGARLDREAEFHDEWAAAEPAEGVMVREAFEAATAPENRHILSVLGDLRGKRVLELGTGLGEAAVYFALQGAEVTACDLSPGMCAKAVEVGRVHGVEVKPHVAPAENTGLPDESFDVIYAGNLLHHVEIGTTLDEIRRLLKPGGVFATWDPLAHNPLINVYRRLASAVRTPDEHPLRMEELELFRSRFSEVHYKTFWFFSQAVFLRFFLWDRVHPSKERYWKKILTDAERLTPFYRRLESWDARLLALVPGLSRYCWNIVVWGRK